MHISQNTLTEQQVFEYESGKTTFLQSCIIKWFPEYFVWRTKLRYKRYLGFMEYKNIEKKRKDNIRNIITKNF